LKEKIPKADTLFSIRQAFQLSEQALSCSFFKKRSACNPLNSHVAIKSRGQSKPFLILPLLQVVNIFVLIACGMSHYFLHPLPPSSSINKSTAMLKHQKHGKNDAG
jgi:hypothetical protein